jgi:starch synthase
MPRYGTISERSHSLHEVIRLSGTEIDVEDDTETLTVKVASIPGIRLQVYFMDNEAFFGRDAIVEDEDGTPFADNAERALFFGRAVLETIRNLRWGPDVVHSFGWVSGLVPFLLSTEYADDDVMGAAKTVYTPDALDAGPLSEALTAALDIDTDALSAPTLRAAGEHWADATICPPSVTPTTSEHTAFSDEEEARGDQLVSLYTQMMSEVPA